MAVTSIAAPSTRAPSSMAALPYFAAATIYVVLLVVGAKLLSDPDTYWQMTVGKWILAHGFPTTDPFSFTFAGQPWIAKEWLSQLILAVASNLGGWSLIVVVSAAAAALAFLFLARFLADRLAPVPTVAFLAGAFVLAAPHMLARPHLLALPVMVAWVAGLARASDEGRAPSWPLLGLMVIWANMHAEFPLGIVMVGAFGLDAIVSAAPQARMPTALRWVGFGLMSVVAGMITPYGPQSMLVTYQILDLGPALQTIAEWRPVDFSQVSALEVILLAGVGLAFWRGFTLRPVRILILLGLIHLALSAERNTEILGMLAPLVIAGPLARQFSELRGTPTSLRSAGLAVPLALLVVLAPATLGLAYGEHYAPAADITPSAAVTALEDANAKRVFNDYSFGGYMIARGMAPFIDGRTELYGGPFTLRVNQAVNLTDLNDFVALLDTYNIDATLLAPSTPAVQLLDRLPGWKRVYADDVAVVHVRTAQ